VPWAISKQDANEWLMAIAKAMPRAISGYKGCRRYVVIDSISGIFIAVDAYGVSKMYRMDIYVAKIYVY